MIRVPAPSPRCRRLLPLLAVAGSLAATPALAAGALYGLVVGIDDYSGSINDLAGAVNDATDIAGALREAGADDVILLTDAAAAKAAIVAAWTGLVDRAGPGDTIVFSYAGHGSQEPEPPGRNGEADGLNENFILGGYAPEGPASLERIVDDEVFDWLSAADAKGIEVVFVADSCHAGSMFRSAGSKTLRTRAGTFPDPELAGDLLTLPPPATATLVETDFRTVTFIGATAEGRLTPELTIEGKPRGALSWAFARAVRGAADTDGDGHLTQAELLAFLVPTVEAIAENQQVPGILPLRPGARPVMRSVAGAVAAAAVPAAPAEAATVAVFVRGGAALPAVDGVVAVGTEADADLVYDPAAGTVDHRVGGRVANGVTAATLPAVLSKWSALAFLKAAGSGAPAALTVPSGNHTYREGDIVAVALDGVRLPYLTLFNLPPDGKVELFIPADAAETSRDWRGDRLAERFRVDRPPYGAEHLVAILTAEPAVALHAALRSMPTAEAAGGLAGVLRTTLAATPFQGGNARVYTEGGG